MRGASVAVVVIQSSTVPQPVLLNLMSDSSAFKQSLVPDRFLNRDFHAVAQHPDRPANGDDSRRQNDVGQDELEITRRLRAARRKARQGSS